MYPSPTIGMAGVSTWATRSSARSALAISTARANALPDALEKSVGCMMRRSLPIERLLSDALLEDPDLLAEGDVALPVRVVYQEVAVAVNTEGAPLEPPALSPDLDAPAREDVADPPGRRDPPTPVRPLSGRA